MDQDPDPPFLPDFWQSVRLLLLEFVAFPSVALSEVLPPFPEWARRALVVGGFLDLVILVPVVEEALFRGLILGGYVQSHRPARAILLCGLVFAVSHLLPWQFPAAFIGGVFLSWLRVETQGLVLPVIGHAFMNGLAWWMLGHPDAAAAYDRHAATLWIPGVISLALGTALLLRSLRPRPRPTLTMEAP